MKLLAADIGGTHTRLIYAEPDQDGFRVLAEQTYASQQYEDFLPVLEHFLEEQVGDARVDACCLAVAGPVKNQVVKVTNLPWIIKRKQLIEFLNTPNVWLINDFIAVAYGVPLLGHSDTLLLQQGSPVVDAAKPNAVVIGAGTGLGAAHLVWQGDHYQALPSEAGHAGFAPANQLQVELLAWMQKSYSHVSLELLLSGGGIKRIYDFLRDVRHIAENSSLPEQMQNTDPAEVITSNALLNKDELCVRTVDTFVDIYAAAASNIALHYYPLDAVYIAGGIAPRLRERMQSREFLQAFSDKGAMTANMQDLTIRLVTESRVGLYGALYRAATSV